MPLHNIAAHQSRMYYAADETSLFKQYCLNEGEIITGINDTRNVLLYVSEGSFRVTLGHYSPHKVDRGTLLFLHKNTSFDGQAVSFCRLIASFFSEGLPLCSSYGFEELRQGAPRFYDRQIPPPPKNSGISCS